VLSAGAEATASLIVTEADTATALGSGDVAVLGTPRLVALCEQATVAAVADQLEAGTTTVGTRVEIDHLRAAPIGATVIAHARLAHVDGRRLVFDVDVVDGEAAQVGRAVVVRAVVNRDRFGS